MASPPTMLTSTVAFSSGYNGDIDTVIPPPSLTYNSGASKPMVIVPSPPHVAECDPRKSNVSWG